MLFVIDMQNDYIDREKGNKYIEDSEKIVKGIKDKIKEAEINGQYIYYTSDIAMEGKSKKINNMNDEESIGHQERNLSSEGKWGSELYPALRPYLEKHTKIKKSYYAIPPKILLELQERFKGEKHIIEEIEFVGVETHICVLANAICIQSAFPKANIVIHARFSKSRDNRNHENALKIMEDLGMEVRRWKDEIRG